MAELRAAYLITGNDGPKISRALARLRARVADEATEQLSAAETPGGDAVAACNALGLFGGGDRLVLVTDVERWKADDVKAVAAYLAEPAPGTTLALVGDVKPDSALAKAVRAAGDVLAYDVARRALPKWVADQFERAGATADKDACRALIELVGDDLDELATEIEKLATWANGDVVTERVARELAAGRAETSTFALTDAWGARDTAAALSASEELLERSDRARRDEIPRLVGLLVNHVGRVRASQALAAAGVRPRDAAAILKVHPFAAEKAFAQAQRFSAEELRDVVVRLAELDHALKGGSRLAPDLELVRALVDATDPGRAAGVGG